MPTPRIEPASIRLHALRPERTRCARSRPARLAQAAPAFHPATGSKAVTACATATLTLRRPAPETEQILCVRSSRTPHTLRDPRLTPSPATSHKIAFGSRRPPAARVRPLGATLNQPPCARPPILGAGALVGPRPARRVQFLARSRPSVDAAFAALIFPPKSCAAGCCCVRNNPRNAPRLRAGNHRARLRKASVRKGAAKTGSSCPRVGELCVISDRRQHAGEHFEA